MYTVRFLWISLRIKKNVFWTNFYTVTYNRLSVATKRNKTLIVFWIIFYKLVFRILFIPA